MTKKSVSKHDLYEACFVVGECAIREQISVSLENMLLLFSHRLAS